MVILAEKFVPFPYIEEFGERLGYTYIKEFSISALSRKRISVMSMLGVYVVMGVGMVVAFLVLIAEIVWKRKVTTRIGSLNVN